MRQLLAVLKTGGARLQQLEKESSVALASDVKKQLITEYGAQSGTDTGSARSRSRCCPSASATSPSTSRRTSTITHSRRGLPVAGRPKRRRWLNYLHRTDINRYRSIIERLGLRR